MTEAGDLLDKLKTTRSGAERDALALQLADRGRPEVKHALIDLIDRPELENERGTLVHCLGQYDCSDRISWLVELVCRGNWEVAHEAMDILQDIESSHGDDVKRGYDLLLATRDASVQDDWRAGLVDELLSEFD